MKSFRNGLAGLVILGASTLSGCDSLIDFASRENAANIQRDGQIRAAQIMANGQQNAGLNAEAQRKKYVEEVHKKYSFFACNYWKDMNGNKLVDAEIEFVGFKDAFSTDERVTFVGHILGKKGSDVFFELYNQNNEVVGTNNVRVGADNWYTIDFVYAPNKLSPGSHVGIWRTADKVFLGKKEINILKPEPKYVGKIMSVGRSNSFENDVLFGSDFVGAVYQGGEGGPIGANVGDLVGIVYQGGEGGPVGASVGDVIMGKVYQVGGEGGPIGAKAGDLVIERTNGNLGGGPAQTVGGSRFPEGRKVITPHKN